MVEVLGVRAPTPSLAEGSRWARLPVAVRFGVAGLTTQVVYLGIVVAAVTAGLHYLLAIVVAQLCAIAFAFPVYRQGVFRSHGPVGRQFVAFLGVWWVGVAASLVVVPVLVETVGVQPLLAQVAVMVVVAAWGFVGHSRLSFGVGPLSLTAPLPPEASS